MRVAIKCTKCDKPLSDDELGDSETDGVCYECDECANTPQPDIELDDDEPDQTIVQ